VRTSYFYANYWPQAVACLPAYAEFVYTGNDDHHYWREFKARWNGGDDLLVVEQDMGPAPEMFDAMESCPSLWCVNSYNHLTESLGFTRFRRELQLAVPSDCMPNSVLLLGPVPSRNLSCDYCTASEVCWRHLDIRVSGALKEHGYNPCVHAPDIRTFH
jgi:hypothetical protein